MRCALWPDHSPQDLDAEIQTFESNATFGGHSSAVFVAQRDGRLVGFVEVSLRGFAGGCTTSPVGYIEGWFVDESARRQAVGRSLIEAAEAWARDNGCREMASDCDASNLASIAAHQRLDYQPTSGSILFRKSLAEVEPTSKSDWIALSHEAISVSTATAVVTDAAAGGIAVFLGTTRAESRAARHPLVALDYEAYPEMALQQLRDLARHAHARWPIIRLALLHRTGRVELGEPSVIIAVATPHRAEAFEACKWLIDTLKAEVAIWKKEIWADGTGSWVDPAGR
jgi:molybdopterin synthase catalytic subunit